MNDIFPIRGFNPCESLLRHTPEQLRTFLRRMKTLNFNSIIIHYDYGWNRYKDIILEECRNAGVEITLMTFGPRTFYRYTDWEKEFFARREDGTFFTDKLECETFPCRFAPGAVEAYAAGCAAWLAELPPEITRIHMRAADGRDYCCCPKCRQLPVVERWNPFIEAFVSTVKSRRPDLKIETDVYTMRYDIPADSSAFAAMDRIMFDTFPRFPAFPLGSCDDICTAGHMRTSYGGSGKEPENQTSGSAMLQKIKEWNAAFPGKIYIHENVMKQSFAGNFQFGTSAYLQDIKTLHALGIQGILFEAFEPGYGAYAELFETLSRAMTGENFNNTPSEIELLFRQYCNGRISFEELHLEKYIQDPVLLKNQKFFHRRLTDISPTFYRDYVSFAFENRDRLDYLAIAFHNLRQGIQRSKLTFTAPLSPESEKLCRSRKLWDFMEDIPEDQDPRTVTWECFKELLAKLCD